MDAGVEDMEIIIPSCCLIKEVTSESGMARRTRDELPKECPIPGRNVSAWDLEKRKNNVHSM